MEDRFDYPAKRKWRSNVWSKCAELVGRAPEKCVCLFLAGDYPHDFFEAQRHGFSPWNLIAVDTRRKAVRECRKHGCLAVQAAVYDVLRAWPEDKRLDVIALDYCGGLSSAVNDDVLAACLLCRRWPSVITVNLLRGRDSRFCDFPDMPRDNVFKFHRGIRLLIQMENYMKASFTGSVDFIELMERFRALIASYKSDHGNLVYDSVVFTADNLTIASTRPPLEDVAAIASARRSLTALFAHQTRRRDKELESMAEQLFDPLPPEMSKALATSVPKLGDDFLNLCGRPCRKRR